MHWERIYSSSRNTLGLHGIGNGLFRTFACFIDGNVDHCTFLNAAELQLQNSRDFHRCICVLKQEAYIYLCCDTGINRVVEHHPYGT